jgi:monoamine oxidase
MSEFDILIIGAGLAGLHCAMRLSEKFPHKHIAIAEAYNYLGGRAFTYTPPENKKIHWEAGAGRINTEHNLMNSYIEKYGLTKIPIMSESSFVSLGHIPQKNTWSSISDLFIKTLKTIPKNIMKDDDNIYCNYFGQFIVHRSRIVKYTKSFYIELLDEISVWQSEINHYLERSWYTFYANV